MEGIRKRKKAGIFDMYIMTFLMRIEGLRSNNSKQKRTKVVIVETLQELTFRFFKSFTSLIYPFR